MIGIVTSDKKHSMNEKFAGTISPCIIIQTVLEHLKANLEKVTFEHFPKTSN